MLITVCFSVIGFWLVMFLIRNLVIDPLQTIAHLLIKFRYTKRVDIDRYEGFFKKNHLLEIREVIDVLPQIFDEYRAIKQNENQLKQRYEELVIHSKYDGLTKVFNRGSLNALVKEIDGATPSCFAIIMVDIDHFKKLNDSMGHQCGDEVLFAVAQTLHAHLAKKDLVFRYGGEEFCIILSDVNEPNAMKIAQRLCQCVEKLKLINKGIESGFVTISVGLSTVTTVQNQYRINDLIKQADKALYKAKSTGRNRACIYCDRDEDASINTHTNGLMSFVHAPTDAANSYSPEIVSSDDVAAALNGKEPSSSDSTLATDAGTAVDNVAALQAQDTEADLKANASVADSRSMSSYTASRSQAGHTASRSQAAQNASKSQSTNTASLSQAAQKASNSQSTNTASLSQAAQKASNSQADHTARAAAASEVTLSSTTASDDARAAQTQENVEEFDQGACARAKSASIAHNERSSEDALNNEKAADVASESGEAKAPTAAQGKGFGGEQPNVHQINWDNTSEPDECHSSLESNADKYEYPMSAMNDYFASGSSAKKHKSNVAQAASNPDDGADVDDAQLVDAVLSIATGRSTSAMQQARAERISNAKVYENNYVVAQSDEVSDYTQAFEMSMSSDETDIACSNSASQVASEPSDRAHADGDQQAAIATEAASAKSSDVSSSVPATFASATDAAKAASVGYSNSSDGAQVEDLEHASPKSGAEDTDKYVDALHMLSTEDRSKSSSQHHMEQLVKRAEDDSKSVYHSNLYARGIDGTVADAPEERISQMKSLLAEVSQIKEDAAHYAELKQSLNLDDDCGPEDDPSPVLNKPMGTDDLESYDEMVDSGVFSQANKALGTSEAVHSSLASARSLSAAASFASLDADVTISPVIEKDGFAEVSLHSNKRGYSEVSAAYNRDPFKQD